MLRHWYKTVAEEASTYAAAAWGTELNKTTIKELHKVQRPLLVRITRSFKTAPTPGLNVLAGLPPLHLQIQKEALLANTLRFNQENTQYNIKARDYQQKIKTHMVLPAHKTSHKYTNLPTSTRTSKTTTAQIYTDGSKTDNGVRAAFCVYHNNQHTDTYKFTLKQENTVFQAEVLAIKEAINWLETHSCKDATIFTHSLASIHAIRKTKQKGPHVATTQRQLEHLVRKCSTQIHWVVAHTGNIGNEAADLATKNAVAGHEIPSGVLLPPSSLRNKLKNITQKLWQAYWDKNEKGYTTKSCYPKVDTDRLIGHPAAIQFLTGNG
ncbi:uncharacterized protein [Parasteatoda tepidariorum]|uniref:uncharacterized protein n=1 Tax=Parasteatoda tepidariorum TaxID=114398 RepID=UPI00077FC336|nr:uncharacterized protein LOC107444794 [Parasteatoda tepidariorum]